MKAKRIGAKTSTLVDKMVQSFHGAVRRGNIRSDLDTIAVQFREDEYERVIDALVALKSEGFGKKKSLR